MAVLLLYPLQLAVNTVKAFLSPRPTPNPVHVYVSLLMLAGAPLSSLASPTLAAPGAGRVVAGLEKVPAPNTGPRAQQPLFTASPLPLVNS